MIIALVQWRFYTPVYSIGRFIQCCEEVWFYCGRFYFNDTAIDLQSPNPVSLVFWARRKSMRMIGFFSNKLWSLTREGKLSDNKEILYTNGSIELDLSLKCICKCIYDVQKHDVTSYVSIVTLYMTFVSGCYERLVVPLRSCGKRTKQWQNSWTKQELKVLQNVEHILSRVHHPSLTPLIKYGTLG